MVEITKSESKYLNSKGVPFGNNGICKTKSRNPKYYLTMTRDNEKLLREFRMKRIIKTVDRNVI